jgi:hypothetical protein
VLAQSKGDDSLVTECKTRMDEQQLLVTATNNPTKKAAAGQELNLAKAASESGNQTRCLLHLDKINKIIE